MNEKLEKLLGKIGIGIATAGLTIPLTSLSLKSLSSKQANDKTQQTAVISKDLEKNTLIYYTDDDKYLAVGYDGGKKIEIYKRNSNELVKISTIYENFLKEENAKYQEELNAIEEDFKGLRAKLQETSESNSEK